MHPIPWIKLYNNNGSEEIEQPTTNIYQFFNETACHLPDKQIFVSGGISFSYYKLQKKIDQFAGFLIDSGVNKGDRVCFLLPNLIHFPVVHFAILKLGAISVPVNPLYTRFEIEKTIKLCEPVLCITLDEFYPKIEGLEKETSIRKILIFHSYKFSF
jgi:acyl-CoA synthetase (AMP-forming)/AMP-acid ligase II